MAMTEGRRWAGVARTIEPDPAWLEPVAERYERFLALSPIELPPGASTVP
jgi:xylulokinase